MGIKKRHISHRKKKTRMKERSLTQGCRDHCPLWAILVIFLIFTKYFPTPYNQLCWLKEGFRWWILKGSLHLCFFLYFSRSLPPSATCFVFIATGNDWIILFEICKSKGEKDILTCRMWKQWSLRGERYLVCQSLCHRSTGDSWDIVLAAHEWHKRKRTETSVFWDFHSERIRNLYIGSCNWSIPLLRSNKKFLFQKKALNM